MVDNHLVRIPGIGVSQLYEDITVFGFNGGFGNGFKSIVFGRILNAVDHYALKTLLVSHVEEACVENEILAFEVYDEPLFKLWPLVGFLIFLFLNCHLSFLLFAVLEWRIIAVIMVTVFKSPAVCLDELDPVGDELDRAFLLSVFGFPFVVIERG